MADFNIAYDKFLKTQGMHPYFDETNKFEGPRLLCSACFNDEGLRLTAESIGISDNLACQNCSNTAGYKLTRELTRQLAYLFFVRGTIERFEYGGFPLIQMNELRESDIDLSPWMENDAQLIERVAGIGLFYFHPRFWLLGEVTPLKHLQDQDTIDKVVDRILTSYPIRELQKDHFFYRIRVNPNQPEGPDQYDSPPKGLGGNNRFDTCGEAVLYASPDIQLCLHECRVTVEDKLYMAKLSPVEPLRLLDLSYHLPDENCTEFESLDMAIHFLFLATKHAYPICGHIARRVRQAGFDGLIYPSYFSYIRTGAVPFDTILGMSIRKVALLNEQVQAQSIPNVALFGHPIAENKVKVESINRVMLNSIHYEMTFGPAYHEAVTAKMPTQDYLKMREEEYFTRILESMKQAMPEDPEKRREFIEQITNVIKHSSSGDN